MKQPSATAYLFGNPVSLFVIVGLLLLTGWGWLTNSMSGWGCCIAFGVMLYAGKCHHQLTDYRNWKREWEGMNGRPPQAGNGLWRVVRYPLGIIIWLAGIVYSLDVVSDPSAAWAAWLYWLGSLAGANALIMPVSKKIGILKKPEAIAVGVCVSPRIEKKTVVEIIASTPDYCKVILSLRNYL